MQEILRRYARLVIEVQLNLKPGDALSINTENSTMGFARMLATMACESTLQTVNIVETNHGKVSQVLEFDPTEHRIKRPPVTGYVMCHLIDLDSAPYVTEEESKTLIEEVGKLGTYGLLSDPVFLDRRIAVPWANVPLPGPLWTMQMIGTSASEEDMWTLFSKLYRLEDEHGLQFWFDQANLLQYRKQVLTKQGLTTLHVQGEGTDFTIDIAKSTQWTGGNSTVPSGRTFMPSLPMQHVHASLDITTAEGTCTASLPFLLLGKVVSGAVFTLSKGKVVSFTADQGMDALEAYFSIDEGACLVSGFSFADHDTIESRYLEIASHPHFNREITTTLSFGGFNLNTLTNQNCDEDIDASCLGRSLVRLEIPIGSNSLQVEGRTTNQSTITLMQEGIFEL